MITKYKHTLVFSILIIFSIVLIRTAWISDDAAITLRAVLNFLNGYGARFNVDERVQAYTHPLWFISISALSVVIKNVFYTTFILSIICSILTVWLLLAKVAKNTYGIIIVGITTLLSKAYIDFSTSGLENPLSHLLIVSAVLLALRVIKHLNFKNLFLFFLNSSLLYLNRPDLLVLILPLVLLLIIKNHKSPSLVVWALVLGLLPVIVWALLSTYYYGFPFPNTAYAKLATGIPLIERVSQGIKYLEHSIYTDPLTIFCIAVGIVIGMLSAIPGVSLSIGVLLYLAYVISIGGDFMEGRFFTAPLLVAMIQIARYPFSINQFLALVVCICGLGLLNISSTLLSDSNYSNLKFTTNGIADERGYYFREYGLLTAKKDTFITSEWKLTDRKVEVACGGLGFKGIAAGPSTHLIDVCGLADPLLSRIPILSSPPRVGHYERALPPGYFESIVHNKNLIQNEKLAQLYDEIIFITRRELNDLNRIKKIAIFNLDKGPKPVFNKYHYRLNVDEKILFKVNNKGSLFLKDNGESRFITSGWATPESWGTWSLGRISRLRLSVPSKENPLTLEFDAQAILSPLQNTQTIDIFTVKGESFDKGKAILQQVINLKGDTSSPVVPVQIVIPITQSEISDGFINLEFRFPTPVQPQNLVGVSSSQDERELTLGLKSAVYKR